MNKETAFTLAVNICDRLVPVQSLWSATYTDRCEKEDAWKFEFGVFAETCKPHTVFLDDGVNAVSLIRFQSD